MKRYEHILVPLDGSEFSEAALPDAAYLANLESAGITLLRVVPPIDITIPAAGSQFFIDEQWELMRAACLDYLRKIGRKDLFRNIKVQFCVMLGMPADVILDFCEKRKMS